MKRDGIKVYGHIGKWYIIDTLIKPYATYYLLESEIYGSDAPHIIINDKGKVIIQDVCNGFEELSY